MSTSRTREKADGELFKSTGIDDNATSTAVTIDASENVFIGQTSLNTANNGHSFGANGNYAHHTSTESTTLILNRKTSDGDILRCRKDNVAVGSIGASGGDLVIGTGDTGIHFHDGVDSIMPWNVSAASYRDNAIDLGTSTYRYKDAYLSGGVVFGPASASNVSSQTLDSYEEGSFTASIRDAPSGGNAQSIGTQYYTKIGNQVTVWILRDNITISGLTSNNTFFFTGLPFTSASTTVSVGSIWWQYINTGNTHVVAPRISPNVSYIRFDELRDNANDTGVTIGALNNNVSDIVVTITYQAA